MGHYCKKKNIFIGNTPHKVPICCAKYLYEYLTLLCSNLKPLCLLTPIFSLKFICPNK